ncbi:fimbrial protein [Acinetobacter boissieri]|uniref:Pilin (Type 1 fimbria component protein) n=1 Tax=Acinetobacter boissieri TaxID=1219383 RepID=A0A1G6H9T7_9GAMM|nr:fimbrial protein [Acinetobacter boissieri]SDB90904.1 Pilin (type 1 fimbria component protein) [Acinetobacter boissieri]
MKILLTSLLGCIGMNCSTITHAACSPQLGFNTIDISMAIGKIIVKPNDPVGKILSKSNFNIPINNSTYMCDGYGGKIIAALMKNPKLSNLGDSIYDTNIPGIGIRLYRELPSATYFSGYYPYERNLKPYTPYFLAGGSFVVEIVKTANQTGSGRLSQGLYSSYYADGYANMPFLTSTIYANTASISSASCMIQGNVNKTVILPTVVNTGFKSIGSTQGEQAFNVSILCNGGSTASNYSENSQISLSFGFTAENSNPRVIANTANSTKKALGVGVQLLSDYKNQNKVITNGSQLDLGSVATNQNAQYDIPLRARYYQTDNKVTAGEVKGLATLTIEYQ